MSNLIAQELDINEIIIPPYAGNFSAWGLLGADLLQMVAKTKILRLSDETINECNAILEELYEELQKRQKIDFDTYSELKLEFKNKDLAIEYAKKITLILKLLNQSIEKSL